MSKNINMNICSVQNISNGVLDMRIHVYTFTAYFVAHYMTRTTQTILRKPYFILSDFIHVTSHHYISKNTQKSDFNNLRINKIHVLYI